MGKTLSILLYFLSWVVLGSICAVLNVINIDWNRTNIVQGIAIVIILGILQGSVLEFPVQTIGTLIAGGHRRTDDKVSEDLTYTIMLNYNLLACSKEDIDGCIKNMFDAYMGNLDTNVSIVMVSATGDDELKRYELKVQHQYRAMIYDTLFQEGVSYINNHWHKIEKERLQRVWREFDTINPTIFVTQFLDDICDKFAKEFMLIHRVSRVVRKCGQYQDLMLLSDGDDEAFTYTDPQFYGSLARPYNQPLFHGSEDVNNIYGRRFDYTLVLDGDTRVEKGSVFELLDIAAAHPDKGIIQPAIKLNCDSNDINTIFMYLEKMRQDIYEPMTNAVTAILGQSGFFGKGMIKNSIYIEKVIGTRENPVERVPIDVLSHDTFEAALLKPYYAGSVRLLEAPSYNYVSWNIRERRWNRGEVLLAMYFWKYLIGKPMRWLQSIVQGDKFIKTKLRTESPLDFVSSYIAHSALRQMFMKPFLLVYIIVHLNVTLKYRYTSIIIIMFLVIVFPKFATCTRRNYKYVLLETIASILQFTPEALVGCVRIFRAVQANINTNVKWIPQRVVEDEFRNSNPFVSSLKHLWGYSLFAVICVGLQIYLLPESLLLLAMLVTLFLLPLYTGFTSLTTGLRTVRSQHDNLRNIEITISSPSYRDGATFKYDSYHLRKNKASGLSTFTLNDSPLEV